MTYALGIDFGTSSTAAAAFDLAGDAALRTRVVTLGNRAAAVPSAVLIRAEGELVFGDDALLQGASEPGRLVRHVKGRLGDGSPIVVEGQSFEAEFLVGEYLRWVLQRVAEREGGPPAQVALTYPAGWRSTRLDAYRDAASRAGIANPTFTSEAVAAALFHLAQEPVPEGAPIAVYDLGGSTFDAGVVRRSPGGTLPTGFELAGQAETIEHLGGVDFDDVLHQLVQGKLAGSWPLVASSPAGLTALRRECVEAKETLSSEDSVDIPVLVPGAPASVHIERREFEHVLRPALAETIGAFRRAVRQNRLEPQQLAAVLLVGGSCQIPLVRAMVQEAVGTVRVFDADPKHAVARGAAVAARVVAVQSSPQPATAALAAPAAQAPTAVLAVGAAPAGARRGLLVAIAGVVVALLVVAGAVVISRRDGGQDVASTPVDTTETTADPHAGQGPPTSTTPNTATPTTTTPTTTGNALITSTIVAGPASPDGMVKVPAGSYRLGSNNPTAESAAALDVTLKDFSIDVTEVTNIDYNKFVQTLQAPAPKTWLRGRMPEDQAQHPVAGVEWEWGQAFCSALRKRLPTEAEWEAAARGSDGRLFPWGDNAALVDLETPGTKPAGSVVANVSPFGVKDTVGSVWEWVAEPYVKIGDTQRVRRGGEYGRVREGVAMRQSVDPTNLSTISETGFRCVTDKIDPSATRLTFNQEHALPAVTDSKPVTTAPAGSALIDERFENPQSGWATRTDPLGKIGYHAPTWYHVEASRPGVSTIALGGFSLANAAVETAVHVDKTETPNGRFRYGLAFRAHGGQRAAPLAGIGNARTENYYAFVVDPRAGEWLLLHEDNSPQRVKISGKLPAPLRVTDPTQPDVLRAEMKGSQIDLFINGAKVATFNTDGYHPDGDVGFYVDNLDETRTHVHFDRLTVTAL